MYFTCKEDNSTHRCNCRFSNRDGDKEATYCSFKQKIMRYMILVLNGHTVFILICVGLTVLKILKLVFKNPADALIWKKKNYLASFTSSFVLLKNKACSCKFEQILGGCELLQESAGAGPWQWHLQSQPANSRTEDGGTTQPSEFTEPTR